MTSLESAKNKIITSQMKIISGEENIDINYLLKNIAEGKVVIPNNKKKPKKKICGIGEGLRTKVNVNIGTSTDQVKISEEIKKLKIAIRYGADTIMDLSVGGNIKKIRQTIIRESPLPVGTVPIYEIAILAKKKGSILKMNKNMILDTIRSQAEDGVDFFTLHVGITQRILSLLKKEKRILKIVSRGGAILASWMNIKKRENPLYEYFDEIIDIVKEFDIVFSLGDSLRPGSVLDATDKVQIEELSILGILAKRAKAKGISVMIEGPGHLPLNQIQANVLLEKRLCEGAPFYVLGPLVTDIASGYDHISASIGGALAGSSGADFLCYVTPSEHLRHPSVQDVKEGLIATKIAAHSADLVKGIKSAWDWNRQISEARSRRDWKTQIRLSIDPKKAYTLRQSSKPHLLDVCTMCGRYCPIRLVEDCGIKNF